MDDTAHQRRVAARSELGRRIREVLSEFAIEYETELGPADLLQACFEMVAFHLGFMRGICKDSASSQSALDGLQAHYMEAGAQFAESELARRASNVLPNPDKQWKN